VTSLNKPNIILASGSAARKKMLHHCGLDFIAEPADIDEASILQKMLQQNNKPDQIAATLAEAKAMKMSSENQNALVIGSDQILHCEGQLFSKAKTIDDAKDKLKALRGKAHTLISTVCLCKNGQTIWTHSEAADLTMHNFDDDFLNQYCDKAGDVLTTCVGAYAFEEEGAWLFSNVDGDYFTILGMPLLPLLNELRTNHGITL